MSKLDDILEDYDDPNANVIEESRRVKDLFLELIGNDAVNNFEGNAILKETAIRTINSVKAELRQKVNEL
jgi:hypothetical protein